MSNVWFSWSIMHTKLKPDLAFKILLNNTVAKNVCINRETFSVFTNYWTMIFIGAKYFLGGRLPWANFSRHLVTFDQFCLDRQLMKCWRNPHHACFCGFYFCKGFSHTKQLKLTPCRELWFIHCFELPIDPCFSAVIPWGGGPRKC